MSVALSRDSTGWQLRYELPARGVRVPAALSEPGRGDELWCHTCVELFVASATTRDYREFNFAPSGAWAAYDFDDYRQRSATLPDLQAPVISCSTERMFIISVNLPAKSLPDWPVNTLCLGLTAVIESQDGTLSYWAIKHPGERPDFHHRAGFTFALS